MLVAELCTYNTHTHTHAHAQAHTHTHTHTQLVDDTLEGDAEAATEEPEEETEGKDEL